MRIAARTRSARLICPQADSGGSGWRNGCSKLLVNAGKYRHNPGKEDEQDIRIIIAG